MTFKVGDVVEWFSSFKDKRGTVVHVVPRQVRAYDAWSEYKDGRGKGTFVYGGGMHRDHVSYFVLVGSKVYWPRVSLLKAVTP